MDSARLQRSWVMWSRQVLLPRPGLVHGACTFPVPGTFKGLE